MNNTSPLSIYYRPDIARVLAALDIESTAAGIVNEEVEYAARARQPIDSARLTRRMADYRRGRTDALAAVALAFGITPLNWVATDAPDAFSPVAQLPVPPWDG